jgi:glycosyltransferase involved in cell wall biosynthesis
MRRLRLSPGHLVLDADDWEGPGGWNDDPRTGYSRLQRRFFAWQERYGLSHADAWTVTSECLRQRAIAFGAAAEKVFILPNGIWDLGKNHFGIRNLDFGKNHFGIRISDFGIRVVGSQNPPFAIRNSKWGCLPFALLYTRFAGVRVPDVVAIWQRVREMAPEARLVVVGQGLGGEEAELGRLPGVELAGWAEPEELPVLLDKVAVAVIPWADTPANRARSSVKVRELMAAGLPIVAYAVGELPALLGDTGVLVPAGDDLAFAQAVVALLADPERARELAAAARARIMAHFTWDRLVEVALAAYGA